MININRVIGVTADAPFNYEWILNGCDVDVSPLMGPASTTVNSTFTFYDQDEIESCNIELKITDSNGCDQEFDISFINPCVGFTATIENTVGYFFVASTSGGSGNPGNYLYEWNYDTTIWGPSTSFGIATLIGAPNPGVAGTTTIYLTVTDEEGCQVTTSFNYTFCAPTIDAFDIINIGCDPSNSSGYTTGSIDLNDYVTPCVGDDIDWTTFDITAIIAIDGPPTPLSAFDISQTNGIISIQPLINLPSAAFAFVFSVTTFGGIVSAQNNFFIAFTEPGCVPGPDPVLLLEPCECEIEICDPPAVGSINLDNCFTGADVDRSTVQIIGMSPFIVGNSAVYNDATNEIVYDAQNVGDGSDQVWVTFSTFTGQISPVLNVTIITDCTPDDEPPLAVADIQCIGPSDSQITFNVTSNDIGDFIDPTSVVITDSPEFGIASVGADGQVTYMATNPPLNQNDEFSYVVSNGGGMGGVSNEATVTIFGAYAGDYNNISVCSNGCGLPSGVFDITNLNPNATSGGTYTALGYHPHGILACEGFDGDNTNTAQVCTNNPAPVPSGWPGATNPFSGTTINLTDAPEGFYFIEYSVTPLPGCTDTRMFVLEVIQQPEAGEGGYFYICEPTAPGPVLNIIDAIEGEDAPGVNDVTTYSCISYPVGAGCNDINFDEINGTIQADQNTPFGEYTFEYSVSNLIAQTTPNGFTMETTCPISSRCNDTTTVTVNIFETTTLGAGISITSCAASIPLLTQFDIQNGGTGAPSVIDDGGEWIITEAPTAFPVTINGIPYDNGAVIQGGDNPTITFTGLAEGTYSFSYLNGSIPCEDVGVFSITYQTPSTPGVVGTDGFACCDYSLCGTCVYNLYDSISAYDPGGVWEVVSVPPGADLSSAFDGDVGTVDFCGQPPFGTGSTSSGYVFDYIVDADLDVCTPSSIRVPIIVYDTSPVTVTATLCNNEPNTTLISLIGEFANISAATGDPNVGSWAYISGGATPNVDYFITGGSPDDDYIVPSTMPTGVTHEFTFTDESVSATCPRVVTLELEMITGGATAGMDAAATYCQGDKLALVGLIGSPTLGGTWSEVTPGTPTYTGPPPIGQNGQILQGDVGNIDLEGIAPGTYVFEYEVDGGICGSDTATVTITVEELPVITLCQAGTTNCNYSIELTDLSDTINTIDVIANNDSYTTTAQFKIRTSSSNCASTNPFNDEVFETDRHFAIANRCTNTIALQENGYIDFVRVFRSDSPGSPINLDLSPTGPNTINPTVASFLSYPAPTAPAVDFTSYKNALEAVIAEAIRNQIDVAAYYDSTPVALVDPQAGGVYGIVTISFRCRHNPAGIFVGINEANNSLRYTPTGDPLALFVNTDFNQAIANGIIAGDYITTCGDELTVIGNSPTGITYTFEWNNFILSAGKETVTPAPGSSGILNTTCNNIPVIQASVSACASPSYQWLFAGLFAQGETGLQIPAYLENQTNPGGSNIYAITATCAGSVCTPSGETSCANTSCNPLDAC